MTARASMVDRKAFPGPIHAETRITRIPITAPSAERVKTVLQKYGQDQVPSRRALAYAAAPAEKIRRKTTTFPMGFTIR